MAHKLDDKETVSWEELAYSNMMEQEAILRLLVKKGIITAEEFVGVMGPLAFGVVLGGVAGGAVLEGVGGVVIPRLLVGTAERN